MPVGRTIFIGDVHGCFQELSELIDRLAPSDSDRVFFLGDLVARGPDSLGVLRLVEQLGARSVLGNHEDRLLEVRAARRRGERGPRLSPSHSALYRELQESDWHALGNLPLYLDVDRPRIRLVHAGVVPGVPIDQQDRNNLLRMRSLNPDGSASDRFSEVTWASHYLGPPHLVFGHDARSGLQFHDSATGLDSGCVYGGWLSALVVPQGEEIPPVSERRSLVVSVRARQNYMVHG